MNPHKNSRMLYLFMRLGIIICLSMTLNTLMAQTLIIQFSGIRNAKGNLRVAFYQNTESFNDERPMMIKHINKKTVVNGCISVSYNDLKPGVYGVAILDDENTNERMDYSWFLPSEGFGFSDYYHSGLTHPKFESFDFVLTKETKTVSIKMRYL